MQENKKELLEKEKDKFFSKKIKIILIALIILIIIFVIFLIYVFIIKSDSCENEKCFFNSLKDCKKVYFVKEDPEYSWLYSISKEASKDSCEVKVKLLEIKKESSDSKILQDKEMICIVPKTTKDFPEKEISRCSGVLKEQLQDLIIQRMYDYLLTNVQEINKSFFEPF
jgi:cell division protein FtsI/penicillin-binding protein 2